METSTNEGTVVNRGSRPLRTMDELLEPFHAAMKPPSQFRVGTEAEKPGLYADGSPVRYDGEHGVVALLDALETRFGWHAHREYEGGPLIALERDGASITLEPGSQLELSGAPLLTIHETQAELDTHIRELREVSAPHGIRWLGLGFQPRARRSDLSFIPKLRYGVMREYLPTRGGHALDMMLRTCTVQANLDYESEADALRKLRIALRMQPIATAMFANSPIVEGKATGERSHRARVWLDVDPDRSGLLPFLWSDRPAGFADYVEWALDVPMFLVKRGDALVKNTGQTFRAFMRDGYQGTTAVHEDWVTHLNTLFPEVRLKKTLEMRGCDALPGDLVCALPALFKGIFYDDTALSRAESLLAPLEFADVEAARPAIAARALHATVGGREVGVWAQSLMDIALDGLARIGAKNERGEDETIHLRPLADLIARGLSPADRLLASIDTSLDEAALTAAVADATEL